jgi:hypothetical protein
MALLSEEERVLLNKMSSVARRVNLGDQINIQKISSAASAGGAASEALTVTGLAADDVILAVTQRVKGANGTATIAWNTQAANALTVEWTANPGAGAIVDVLVLKATGSV